MKTTSTFAASTCGFVSLNAALRMNALRRGSTAWIVALPSSGRAATASQSPTAGCSPSCRSFPVVSARSSPSSV